LESIDNLGAVWLEHLKETMRSKASRRGKAWRRSLTAVVDSAQCFRAWSSAVASYLKLTQGALENRWAWLAHPVV
jgi:hypothetical protein